MAIPRCSSRSPSKEKSIFTGTTSLQLRSSSSCVQLRTPAREHRLFQSQTGLVGWLAIVVTLWPDCQRELDFSGRGARFTLCVDAHIAKNFDLAGKTHLRIFLQIIAQPEFLHEAEGVGVGFGRNRHAVRTTQTIAMAISKFPHAAVDGDIVL